MSIISYKNVNIFPGWEKMPSVIEYLIKRYNVKKVLEAGAGANPTLNPRSVQHLGIEYNINDVNLLEIEKADKIYNKEIFDLSSKDFFYTKSFDMVFSRMASEHFKDGETFHKNVYKILNPGGISVHCFSTLFSFPFIINKITPDFIGKFLFRLVAPRDEFQHGKFKAYYSWCRGPSKKMIKKFEGIGYKIIEYTGYFGHNYYMSKFPLLDTIEKKKTNFLLKHPIPYLTSYALIILTKK